MADDANTFRQEMVRDVNALVADKPQRAALEFFLTSRDSDHYVSTHSR